MIQSLWKLAAKPWLCHAKCGVSSSQIIDSFTVAVSKSESEKPVCHPASCSFCRNVLLGLCIYRSRYLRSLRTMLFSGKAELQSRADADCKCLSWDRT